MRHILTRHADTIEIQMIGMGIERKHFLKRFKTGCPDSCRCEDVRYQTLNSLHARPIHDGVEIVLRSRNNIQINLDEAEQCLDNVMNTVLSTRQKRKQKT